MRRVAFVLGLAGLLAGAVGIVGCTAIEDALFDRGVRTLMAGEMPPIDGMRVLVCGSASPLGNDPERAQACIAVITNEHFLLFDVGARSPMRMAQARLPMARLTGVFLTHFHSDHIASLPDVNLVSWVQGRSESLRVYGGEGVREVVDGFNAAYRLDRKYRMAHHGSELLRPAAGPMTAVPFTAGDVVWRDALLTVTSFPVEHPPISPAVGYRVDYRGRSVVISGDTNATESLFAAAQGADLLLHDALSRHMLDKMIEVATELEVPVAPQIMTDVIDYHADSLTLEEAASQAGVRQLALYHLVPSPPNAIAERLFRRGLSRDTLLVRDLHTFDLPPDSSEIQIHAP
ncbi:MAG: MBL fold metallo-hydrolase [Deltaproteobacteria bacterium]|jgi:ribonuclease Z|nr:MBL fold metallo-hydrolase [Deltaproteobacteria bacterium]MBW2496873.1 MBL fold metallo-hydrolase [Deltaproteobacteria bacterium]